MKSKKIVVLPETQRYLQIMGEQIKLARLRRDISLNMVAERAMLSRATVCNIEKGSPSVCIGAYAKVLHAITGLDKDLLLIA
jgi:transcriptional regulator with XRE-family HTH domain